MRYADSETQKLLRDTARSYLAEHFPWERLYGLYHSDGRLSDDDLKGFAGLGWFGLLAPESAGGGGATLLDAAAVIEEFGYAAVPAPVPAGNVLAALLTGSPGEAAHHVSDLAAGRRIYTVSEATRVAEATRLRPQDSRQPLTASRGTLSGSLPLVPFAQESDFVAAPLTVDGQPAFALVALEPAKLERLDLLDRPGYCDVSFENVPFDSSHVLATGDEAVALHARCDALVTVLSLIELAGMMQRILEMTSEFVKNRVQFGKPIATFQAVRHRAAELLTQTETTRWAAYHALWRFQNDPSDTEEIWLAKHWAVRAVDRVYQISHLLHGGIGVGIEYPLHLLTQGVAAFAVRGGTMDEMVARAVETIESKRGAAVT